MADSKLIEELADHIEPMGFARFDEPVALDGLEVHAVWRLRTWNVNRAVPVVRRVPEGPLPAHPGKLAQAIKIPLGKQLGYFPFFYTLGIQLVILQPFETAVLDLPDYTDKIDNQRAIVQSIHLVDEKAGRSQSVRTWGQVVTAKYQDAIEAALKSWVRWEAKSRPDDPS